MLMTENEYQKVRAFLFLEQKILPIIAMACFTVRSVSVEKHT